MGLDLQFWIRGFTFKDQRIYGSGSTLHKKQTTVVIKIGVLIIKLATIGLGCYREGGALLRDTDYKGVCFFLVVHMRAY